MFYAILFKEPFVYISGEKAEFLETDFEFIIENQEECELEGGLLAEEFKVLSPAEFTKILDEEVKEGVIYTYQDAVLVRRYYRKAPCFYLNPEQGIDYSTYCTNPNSIKAGLLTNGQLLPVVSDMLADFGTPERPELSIDPPYFENSVVAYVCIPIVAQPVPIGVETKEEQEEMQADVDD